MSRPAVRATATDPFAYLSDQQREAFNALAVICDSENHRGRTVQFMPVKDGARIEVIEVATGDYFAVVDVLMDGRLVLQNPEVDGA